jgi:TPR repeat protein
MTPKAFALTALVAASLSVHAGDFEDGSAALKAGNASGALSLFHAAAARGEALAQHALAQLYEQGTGVVADPTGPPLVPTSRQPRPRRVAAEAGPTAGRTAHRCATAPKRPAGTKKPLTKA